MASQLVARHWIDGEWVDARDRAESINPATGETIGTYTEAGEAEAKRAIAAALKAFKDTDWRENRRLRAKVLNEMAERFEARADDLVEILSLENGKVEAEARFEVSMVPAKLRFYAALALTDFGRAMETSPGRYTTTLREAIGVVSIIAPWNSPVVLFIRSLAPALAAGCTVVGKLPGFTAQTNARMCEVFGEVTSLPKGVLNVFTEVRSAGARVVIDSPHVPVISLTGSSKTGQAIMAAGARNMKRFGGELGGKTPIWLFDDADLDKALLKVEKALTVFAVQFCMTGSRLLVHRPILDAVRTRLAARLEAVKVGPAADPASDMGPMINIANVQRVDSLVDAAIAAGAKVIVRGGPFREGASGERRLLSADAAGDQRPFDADRAGRGVRPGPGHASLRHGRGSCRASQQLRIWLGGVGLVDERGPPTADRPADRCRHGLDQQLGHHLRRDRRRRQQAERPRTIERRVGHRRLR